MVIRIDKRMYVAAVICTLMLLGLSACNRSETSEFHSIDVTGADYARTWSMPDAYGQQRSLDEFKGQVVYIFFGYTQCPDVCPTTMAEIASVKKNLGTDSRKFQVIFVTVDPERDTPEILRAYVGAFDENAIALVGNSEQLDKMAREFKVVYQKVPGQSEGTYTMDHSAGGYIYDTQGKLRLYSKYGMPVADLTADIVKLLQGR
ncbi:MULTISPECIES: SCO family protein [Pseudomonadota]